MVVGVEEGQGLLLEEEEHSVDQFEVLGEVVELHEQVSTPPMAPVEVSMSGSRSTRQPAA